jgi:peptidoglycan biosynthesis protein MviN/MurJ (putative lipid II flippase)
MSDKSSTSQSGAKAAQTMLRFASASTLWFNLFTLIVIAAATLFLHFMLRGQFDDLGIELPALTALLLNTPAWLLLGGYVVIGALLVAKESFIRSRGAALIINLLSIGVLACMVLALALAIFLPLRAAMMKLAQ